MSRPNRLSYETTLRDSFEYCIQTNMVKISNVKFLPYKFFTYLSEHKLTGNGHVSMRNVYL